MLGGIGFVMWELSLQGWRRNTGNTFHSHKTLSLTIVGKGSHDTNWWSKKKVNNFSTVKTWVGNWEEGEGLEGEDKRRMKGVSVSWDGGRGEDGVTLCPIHSYFFWCVSTCKNGLLIFSVTLFGFSEYLILACLFNNKGLGFGWDGFEFLLRYII